MSTIKGNQDPRFRRRYVLVGKLNNFRNCGKDV